MGPSPTLVAPTSEHAPVQPASGTPKSSQMMRQRKMCAPSWVGLPCLGTPARHALQVGSSVIIGEKIDDVSAVTALYGLLPQPSIGEQIDDWSSSVSHH